MYDEDGLVEGDANLWKDLYTLGFHKYLQLDDKNNTYLKGNCAYELKNNELSFAGVSDDIVEVVKLPSQKYVDICQTEDNRKPARPKISCEKRRNAFDVLGNKHSACNHLKKTKNNRHIHDKLGLERSLADNSSISTTCENSVEPDCSIVDKPLVSKPLHPFFASFGKKRFAAQTDMPVYTAEDVTEEQSVQLSLQNVSEEVKNQCCNPKKWFLPFFPLKTHACNSLHLSLSTETYLSQANYMNSSRVPNFTRSNDLIFCDISYSELTWTNNAMVEICNTEETVSFPVSRSIRLYDITEYKQNDDFKQSAWAMSCICKNGFSEAQARSFVSSRIKQRDPEQLWVDIYRDAWCQIILENEKNISHKKTAQLDDWLRAWISTVEVTEANKNFANRVTSPLYSDSENSSDSCVEFQPNNLFVLCCPSSVGKSSIVYHCADKLGLEIIEVHPGHDRSKLALDRYLGEATLSHGIVKNNRMFLNLLD